MSCRLLWATVAMFYFSPVFLFRFFLLSVEKHFRWITKDLISISIIIYIQEPHQHIGSLNMIFFFFFPGHVSNELFHVNCIDNANELKAKPQQNVCNQHNIKRKTLFVRHYSLFAVGRMERKNCQWKFENRLDFFLCCHFVDLILDLENRTKWVSAEKPRWATHFHFAFSSDGSEVFIKSFFLIECIKYPHRVRSHQFWFWDAP